MPDKHEHGQLVTPNSFASLVTTSTPLEPLEKDFHAFLYRSYIFIRNRKTGITFLNYSLQECIVENDPQACYLIFQGTIWKVNHHSFHTFGVWLS